MRSCSQWRAHCKKRARTCIDVSTGQTVPWQKPVYGRMWQTPFADKVRNKIGIATMAVGNIYEPDHVNSIIAAGRADLCAIARPHLANPAWTLEAAARQGYQEQWWPKQYLSGKSQLERNLQRAQPKLAATQQPTTPKRRPNEPPGCRLCRASRGCNRCKPWHRRHDCRGIGCARREGFPARP